MFVRLGRLGIALILAASAAPAQTSSSTGAIRGILTDPQGAAVTGAHIALHNQSLSIERKATTGVDGSYTFPLLPPAGGYALTIDKEGFTELDIKDVTVKVTESTVADGRLSVGSVAQEISVTSASPQIDTTSSTLGGVVTSRVITGVPLPTRNVFDLMATDAGVAAALDSPSSTIGQGSGAIYVAGARSTANNLLLNGVDSNSIEFHTLAPGAVPIPSPDAIQEFKTQTSLYDATTGFGSGGTMSLVTRSGTTNYHGVAYEFLRNTDLNASDYFSTTRPVMQQNQFGGSFGGPIPASRGWLFFVNYEGIRQKNGVTGTVSGNQWVLPTDANGVRQADATHLASAFNLSPASIDPVAVNLLAAKGPYGGYLIPSGTGAAVGQLGGYHLSVPVLLNEDQFSPRIDRDFSIRGQSDHLAVAAFYNKGKYSSPIGSGTSAEQGYYYPLENRNVSIIETHTFTSHLINELVLGGNFNGRDIEPLGSGVTVSSVGMNRSNSSVFPDLPGISLTSGLTVAGFAANVDRTQHTANFDLRDTGTWVHGKNNVRVGFETRREEYNQTSIPGSPLGSISFTGKIIGPSAIVDFLEGAVASSSFTSGIHAYRMRNHDYIVFAQDDYYATSKLTLNLGVRYDHLGLPFELDNHYANFDPSLLTSGTVQSGGQGLQAGFVQAGINGVSRSTLLNANNGSFSPRAGFAYNALGGDRLVVRGGFGLFYQAANDMQNSLIINPPYQITGTYTNVSKTTGLLANPFPTLPNPSQFPIFPTFQTLTSLNPTTGVPVTTGTQVAVYGKDRYARSPYTENWNFTIDSEFVRDWILELGYLGTNGRRQTATLSLNNALLVNATSPGRLGLTTNSYQNAASRVPYFGISQTGWSEEVNKASSSYNAFLVSLTHQLQKGLLVKAAYTRSKTLDNFPASDSSSTGGSGQIGNQYHLGLNYGISAQDMPNRLVITELYETPWFKHGALSYLLGRWQVSGIQTYQSGGGLILTQNSGGQTLSGSTGYAAIVSGCALVNPGSIKSHAGATATTRYLNPACATTQTSLTGGAVVSGLSPDESHGTQSYSITPGGTGYLLGPSTRSLLHAPFQHREDLAISKNFPIGGLGEGGNLEFRAEAFKLLNNAIFSAPNTSAGSAAYGTITSTIDNTGRQLQFAAKLSF